jgi:hypothetical protein
VTISKIINHSQYDFPNLNLKAGSTTTAAMIYNFPDRDYAYALTSPVFLNGVQQDCLFGGGVNNFSSPYVGVYMAGGDSTCPVRLTVNQENNTNYNIDIEPSN